MPGIVPVGPVQGAQAKGWGSCRLEGGIVRSPSGRGAREGGLDMVGDLIGNGMQPFAQIFIGVQKAPAGDFHDPTRSIVLVEQGLYALQDRKSTRELQSREKLVCRLLLEKKN